MQLKNNHTPGPWRLAKNVPTATIPGHIIKQNSNNFRPIASVPKGGTEKGAAEQLANAELMNDSPALLESLFGLCDRILAAGLQDHFPSTFSRAMQALAPYVELAPGEPGYIAQENAKLDADLAASQKQLQARGRRFSGGPNREDRIR